jgi:hypothetical protein
MSEAAIRGRTVAPGIRISYDRGIENHFTTERIVHPRSGLYPRYLETIMERVARRSMPTGHLGTPGDV